MRLPQRFLQAATAALYMGPLLAGLSGYGWGMIPPFVSIFVLWLVLTRPHQWPQTNAEWLTPRAWAAAFGQILSQILLVTLMFGIGRGIGGVLGFIPAFHPILPLALSFTAIPLMRLVWRGEEALEQGVTVDDLLYDSGSAAADRAPLAATLASIAPLLTAEDDTPLPVLRRQLDAVIAGPDAWAALALLGEELAGAPTAQHAALRRALIVWSTDPENLAAWQSAAAVRAAFTAAGHDCLLLDALLPRARLLLQARPSAAPQFPDAAVLDDTARRLDRAETIAALRDLTDLLRAAHDLAELRPSIASISRASRHGWRDRPVAATA